VVAKAVFGLGNPGRAYALTRHNIGFEVIDRYRTVHRSRGKGRVQDAAVVFSVRGVLLAKPLTFMNDSGPAVRSLMERHRISPENALVVYDDLDLPLGKLRLLSGGGAGSHKGMQSVIAALGTERFPRLRLGIEVPGRTAPGQEFVLERFPLSEWEQIQPVLLRAVEAIDAFVARDIEHAMTRYNRNE
jgi:peptidyl-tRNA hydrolase, PTH1 family